MKRTLGCFSIYGAIAALIVAIGVGSWMLLRGSTLFSPGPLTAVRQGSTAIQGYVSHAEMESKCTLCHRPWHRVATERCLACHAAVEREVATGTGLHGRLDDPKTCVACHPDHLGREADIAQAALDRYPHDQVGFSLVRHQQLTDGTPFACAECHAPGGYDLDVTTCTTCHSRIDAAFTGQHVADYGAGCLSCHDGRAMPERFDHGVLFPLDGAHGDLACDTCHVLEDATRLSGACVACHEEPAIHRGGFGTNCAACHSAAGWLPARLRAHAFPLDHGVPVSEAEIPCLTCHPDGYAAYTCYGCHEHEPDAVERAHREERMTEIEDCAHCHPTGQEEEEPR
jgi:hypothetical protein